MRKFIYLLFAGLLFNSTINAQIFDGDTRRAKKEVKREKEKGWDITLPIEDRLPEVVKKNRNETGVAAIDNWGRVLVLPNEIRDRVAVECTKKVVVKVVDTAGKLSHTALQQGQLPGSNYTSSPTLDDIQGHGTHVAGIITGDGFGIANELVKKGLLTFKPVKVLNDNGSGSFEWLATAIKMELIDDAQKIAAGTAVVYNGSLGGGTNKVAIVETELKAGTLKGVNYFFAAGNTGVNGVNYPGGSEYVVACGSIGQSLKVSSFSTRGEKVLVGQPGESIISTYKNNTSASLSGTSMATPNLAGCAAIALSKWGMDNLNTPTKMANYLAWCASDLAPQGKDNDTGWGLLYVKNILDKNPINTPGGPVNPPPPPPPSDPIREPRLFTYQFLDVGKMVWGNSITSTDPTIVNTKSKSKVTASANNVITITSITLSVTESNHAAKAYQKTEKNVKDFFKNRGLILKPEHDYADAALWVAFFLDMSMDREYGQKIEISNIQGQDENGNKVFWSADQIKKW